jgi:hypothetical protein
MSDPAFSGSSNPATEGDQDDAASSIVVTTIKEAEITQLQLVTGIVLTVLSGLVMCYVLMEIQRHHYTRLADVMDENEVDDSNATSYSNNSNSRPGGGGNELELEESGGHQTSSNNSNMTTVDISTPSSAAKPSYLGGSSRSGSSNKRSLPWYTKLYIVAQVGILILLNYLLLVFLPASISLSLLAAFLVWVMVLHQVILDETCRRHRADRVLAVLACFLVVAASLSLATFARMTQQEGTIYKGPARIIGYDMDQYSNHGKEAIRADLLVSFGGEWACPENPAECQAKVRGVLCKDKYQDPTDDVRRRRSLQLQQKQPHQTRRRRVAAASGQRRAEDAGEADQEEKGGEKDVDDLVKQNQELQNEVNQEEETNEELNEDLEDEEDANEELSEDLEDGEGANDVEIDDYMYYGNYSFDDGWYDDAYWTSYDWSSLWGEYACGELFNEEMDELGVTYDYTQVPGNDSWPFVTIYGSCNSCDAYLVDFFSTEHFAGIQTFLVHSRYYGVAAAIVALLALVAGIQQRFMRASKEREIELLSCHGTRSGSSGASERPFVSA